MTSDRESAQPAPPNEPETNDAVIDSTLLRRMADGSTAAFETLRNRHRERLYWLCLREMRGNREDAEDGLCAAFDNAARNLGNYVERDPNVAALLTTFAKNACRNLLRARSRDTSLAREVTEQIARGAPQADLNCATCTDEERAELRRCIEELNPTLREPMTMKVYGAMDVREIATKLGITAHTVSQRIHRAKCELAKRLTDANTPQIIAAQMAEARLIALTLPSGRSVARRVQLGAHIPLRPAHVETLRRYVAQHPRGWVKRMELANQLLVAGDLGSALMEFTKVAADRPHELEVWLRIGEILRVQERWADARRGYEAALEHATAGAGQHHIHGWIALCCGSVEGALAAFRRAARLDPGNAAHWHAIGFTASDAQRSDEGAAAFDRALALNPDDVIALTGSHDALQHLGRDAEIVPRLERALSLAPNDVMTLKLLAVHRTSMSLVFGAEGERTRAMIRRATRLAPDTSEAWEPLQHFYDARGDRESAEAVWRNFLARRPGDARAWRLLAGQLMGSESKASAVTAIRRAAELAPDDPLAQRALCEMLARTGETAEARAAVERLLKTFPDQWETWSSAGHDLATYLDAPDWGCELSARATQLQPALPVTWRSYGATLCTAGRFDEGDAAYDRCWQLTTQPRHPGRTLEVAERFLPAQRDLLEKWLTRALTDAAAWMPICAGRAEYIRARALEGLGRSDAAAAAYRRALASDQLSDDHRRHAQDALRGLGDAAGASAPKRGRPKA